MGTVNHRNGQLLTSAKMTGSTTATTAAEQEIHRRSFDRCTRLDDVWFEFIKLLSNLRATEEELVAGTARLIPAFCYDPKGTCASISLGSEECHYSSDNFSTKSCSWIQSVTIPSCTAEREGRPALGHIHIFQLSQGSTADSIDDYGSASEPCAFYPSLGGMENNTGTGIAEGNPSSPNEEEKKAEEEKKTVAPRGRVQMVAELLGQTLSHRRSQEERCLFFEDSNDLHGVLEANESSGENQQLILSQVNPSWMRTLGWSREDLIGKNILEFIHPQDTSSVKHFFKTHSDDKDPTESTLSHDERLGNPNLPVANKYCCENRLRAADGTYHWICWSVLGTNDIKTPVSESPEGRRLLITGRVFTVRKNAEIELWESHRRLQESQKIARLGQWELDLPRNELFWSDEIYRLFRIDKDKFGASYEAFLNAIHPDDRDLVNNAYTSSLETKKPYSVTHRLLFPDGTVKWVNELCRTEYDETGKPLRSIGTVQDITELRQAQEDLRIAKEKAEEADRLKSAFLANMSHDLRTPLNAVIGYTDLMLTDDDETLSKSHREFLEIIKNSGNQLLTLISDILDVSKIEAGQMRLENKPYSLRGLLRSVAFNATGLLSRKGKGKIELKGPSDGFLSGDQSSICDCIMGDSARLQQVLNNLISNAIKFTDSGSVEYGVRLVDGPETKMVEFFVTDTGIGVSPEDQRLIFEPFRQSRATSESHELGGTGLGLAIVGKLVELMGGKIGIQSKTGADDHGSTFHFTVPYIPASDVAGSGQGSESLTQVNSSSASVDKLSGKILLVDDSKVNLRLIERVIVKMGCSSITATNGRVAVSMFQRDPSINLILMDKEMPEMDGLSATQEIRMIESKEKRPPIPIIALTAAAMNGDREECLAAGCTDYLAKPLDREKLHRMLTTLL